MRRTINLFCLAGIAVAMVPIFVSWTTADESLPLGIGRHVSAFDVMSGSATSSCPCLLMSATIFTMATVILLVSPLGSLFQLVGIGVFFIGTPFQIHCAGAYCIWNGTAGIGIVLAGTAAALSLLGIVLPRGIKKGPKLVRLRERFITFAVPFSE